MTRRLSSSLVMAVMAAGLMVLAPEPAAAGPDGFNRGAALHAGVTSCPSGTLVINVVEKVTGDVDSGDGGNNWATDDYVRLIKVVQTGSGTFCAMVSYQGNFTTYAGLSPSGVNTVGADVVGAFEGGYTGTITGTLKAIPTILGGTYGGTLLRAKGSVGTFDYGCNTNVTCPGRFSWIDAYFNSGYTFDYLVWGWTYHGGNNGTWVNASTGNSGDITGN